MINLFILDWDNTLFPTHQCKTNLEAFGTNREKDEFVELDIRVYKLLLYIHKYGNIHIVTNANYQWIVKCLSILHLTNNFIKKNQINIISARNDFEKETSNQYKWKELAFKKIMNKYKTNKKIINIISCGDDFYEYDALLSLNEYFEDDEVFLLKNIQFVEKPSIGDLIGQLYNLNMNMKKIIFTVDNIDIKFVT